MRFLLCQQYNFIIGSEMFCLPKMCLINYVFVICFVLLSEVNGKINLALHKRTNSSTPYDSNLDSSKVVDGIIGTSYSSCFYAGNKDGWISVDLGKMFRIQTVIVHGRLDSDGYKLKYLVVRLTPLLENTDIVTLNNYEKCNTYNKDVINGQKMVFQCKDQLSENRYVILGPHSRGYFYVCEVEVYERELKSFGCFEDIFPLPSFSTIQNSTLNSCIHKCRMILATFAALKDGNICNCVDRVSKRKISSEMCNTRCNDNSSFSCGGPNAHSIYSVCSPGYYGQFCDSVCHCKEGTSCNGFGICIDDCQTGWKGEKCDEFDEYYNPQLIGCFDESRGFYAGQLQGLKCAKFCNNYDFNYFGVEGYYCYCLDELDHMQLRDDCRSKMNVSTVCRLGSYGDFCLNSCHCSSDLCHKNNGTCQRIENCMPGWKGSDCNIRDCSVNNGACNEHSECVDSGDDDDPFCLCQDGYNDLRSCEDEDECKLGTFQCGDNSKCHNIPGSYKCECFNGYARKSSSSPCEDIDECQTEVCDTSSTECHNNMGSFYCSCRDGFTSGVNNTLCHDIDECDRIDWGGCDPVTTNCSNTIGSFECLCKDEGLVFNKTSKFCQVQNYTGSSRVWPVIISVIVLIIVLIVLLGIILIMNHLRKLRKRLSNLSSKDNHSTKENLESTDIPLENLDKYFRTHESEISKQFLTAPKQINKDCKYGTNVELKDKNRFKNVIPYDFNRVILKNPNSTWEYANYINASYISEDGTGQNARFIASQGPTDSSIEDFLLMLMQEKVDAIVMLTMIYEEGKQKCSEYWPETNDVLECGNVTVSLESSDVWTHFIIRRLNILNKKTGEKRQVSHYLYTSWVDKGVPSHLESLLHLRRKVISNSRDKILVHCSAGIGRTGTFLAIHFLLNQAASHKSVNVVRCLYNLRAQRAQMIQNTNQYELCYQAVILDQKIGNTSIPADNLESFRRRLVELNRESDGHGNLIQRQYKALQEMTFGLEPSSAYAFLSVVPNNTWYGHYFPGFRKSSAFVAGIIIGDLKTIGLLGILSQPGSIALCFDDTNSSNILDSLLPSKDDKMSVEENVLVLKGVSELLDIKMFTYELTPYNAIDNVYSNVTNSREFSIIRVPYGFKIHAKLISDLWKVSNNSQTEGENRVFLLGSNYSDVGTFMAAVNIFEMMDVHKEANIFQVALDLLLIHPEVLDLVSFSLLHALAEQYLSTKTENTIKALTSDIDVVYANSSSFEVKI